MCVLYLQAPVGKIDHTPLAGSAAAGSAAAGGSVHPLLLVLLSRPFPLLPLLRPHLTTRWSTPLPPPPPLTFLGLTQPLGLMPSRNSRFGVCIV